MQPGTAFVIPGHSPFLADREWCRAQTDLYPPGLSAWPSDPAILRPLGFLASVFPQLGRDQIP